MQKLLVTLAFAAAATFGLGAAAAQAGTLDDVKAKGFIQCGVNTGLPGFGNPDSTGKYTGFDVDYCRAVAAAIFGDPEKVKYTPLDGTERFPALQSGEVDLLVRNTTWTMSRDTTLGFTFAGVNYYDGEGFMVRKSPDIEDRQGSRRRHDLRPGRHRHRHRPCRLLQEEQPQVHPARHRQAGRRERRL